jgi:hypothetical protein
LSLEARAEGMCWHMTTLLHVTCLCSCGHPWLKALSIEKHISSHMVAELSH